MGIPTEIGHRTTIFEIIKFFFRKDGNRVLVNRIVLSQMFDNDGIFFFRVGGGMLTQAACPPCTKFFL